MKVFLFTFYKVSYPDDFPGLHRDVVQGNTLKEAYDLFIKVNTNNCFIIAISDVTEITDNF